MSAETYPLVKGYSQQNLTIPQKQEAVNKKTQI